MQHEENWIILAEILGPRSAQLRPLIEAFGSPEAIFAADESALRAVLPHAGVGTLKALMTRKGADVARATALWCHSNGVRILPLDSVDYPLPLRELDEPPAVLYCRGRLPDFSGRAAVGVVGTRRADAYGEQVAYKLSFELAAAGAVIVSGMADGLDGIATAAALNAGGVAIAVLGCGIDVTYPRHHGKLMRECGECGAVISEFLPGTPPNGYNFPIRNRLISALSDAVLVVEAGEHSGALITARYAVMQGRTLYAVPGDITAARSVGSNRLLQAGARPALSAEDVLSPLRTRYHSTLSDKALCEAVQYSTLTPEALTRFGVRCHGIEPTEAEKPVKEKRKRKTRGKEVLQAVEPTSAAIDPDLGALTPRQRDLYALLPADTPFTVDHLTERGIPVSEAVGTLTVLEIYGLLASKPGGVYVRK